jgi:hypothetical protein
VIFGGRTLRLRDLKGMRYLARLLADPGREYHVLDLVAAETGRRAQADRTQPEDPPRSMLGDAGEVLDTARQGRLPSSKPAPPGTPSGPHRPTPNATSSFTNSPAHSA